VSTTVLVLLGVLAVLPTATVRLSADSWVTPGTQVVVLAAAGLLAALAAPVTGTAGGVAQVVGVLAAAGGASPVVRAVFRLAGRRQSTPLPAPPEVLRGGAAIGVLERAAVAATLLAGWPEGLAVVLAVKGLARYPELREARAGEQFIIGTFTSVLWAVGCWGSVQALLS
jgi:F0F1-type ATP synthase membrane subunit c/vacuolar-type H+-ATPase subunit K